MSAGTRAVLRALLEEGRAPLVHRRIMARHRREWPALWLALDALVAEAVMDAPTTRRAGQTATDDVLALQRRVNEAHARLASPAPVPPNGLHSLWVVPYSGTTGGTQPPHHRSPP